MSAYSSLNALICRGEVTGAAGMGGLTLLLLVEVAPVLFAVVGRRPITGNADGTDFLFIPAAAQ